MGEHVNKHFELIALTCHRHSGLALITRGTTEMNLTRNVAAALAFAAVIPWAIAAENANDHHHMVAQTDSASTHVGTGTVTFVDAAAGRVKIAHDAIPSLKWPAMRMEFKAKDPAVLKGISKGDRVEFSLEKSGDEYVVSAVRPVK